MTAFASTLTRINARDVDLSLGTVKHGKDPPAVLRPQALAVLKLLTAKPGALVSKDELMTAVWPGIAVTDDSLVQCITEIRKALGDDAHAIIKTVPKRGYVFEPGNSVEPKAPRYPWTALAAAAVAVLAILAGFLWFNRSPPVPGHVPSIAVLPFDDMSADKSLAYMGDGVAEDIISMLARSPDVMVIARNSSFTYKDRPVDIRKVGSELGVDYVLEGSVRKEGGVLRIVAQLNEAKSGAHLWSERFDKAGTDPWALQDEVTGKIIGALTGEFGQLKRAQYRDAWGKDTANLEEYDYYLRGHDRFMVWTPEGMEDSGRIWNEGLKKFPESGLLQIKLGFYHFNRAYNGWSQEADADYRRAGELVREGLRDPKLSPLARRLGHWLFAYVAAQERDFTRAVSEANTAASLAPYDAYLLGDLAQILIMAGQPDQAIDWASNAIVNDPAMAWNYHNFRGWAYETQGKYEESLAAFKLGKMDIFINFPLLMVIDLVNLNRLDEAKTMLAKALKLDPTFTQAKWRDITFYSDMSIVDREVADLAKAGLPEK